MKIKTVLVNGMKLHLAMKLPRPPVNVEKVEFSKWRKIRARQLVRLAIEGGLLPTLDGSIRCSDCDLPASCYDHRNYSFPLRVEPTCISCNVRRGPEGIVRQRKSTKPSKRVLHIQISEILLKELKLANEDRIFFYVFVQNVIRDGLAARKQKPKSK